MFKIRELGVLPDEAFEKYQNVDRTIVSNNTYIIIIIINLIYLIKTYIF